MPFFKPEVAVSKCLYQDPLIKNLDKYMNLSPICPIEGLGYKGNDEDFYTEFAEDYRFYNLFENTDCTDALNTYARNTAPLFDAFILNNGSSCGTDGTVIYNPEGNMIGTDDSMFAKHIKNSKMNLVTDANRLKNEAEYDSFLSKLFCLVEFNNVRESGDLNYLNAFHRKHKYLNQLYSFEGYEQLNRLIDDEPEEVFPLYEKVLRSNFDRIYAKSDFKALTLEIMNEFKDYINLKEQDFIREILEDFESGAIPQLMIEYLLKNYLLRFNITNGYNQSFFNRYPKELRL